MATTIEYALMAGDAYLSTRYPINQFPIPDGWTEFFHVPDQSTSSIFQATSGFEAVSFKRTTATGTEIVISFAGTYPSDVTGDLAADLALAAGTLSDQLKQAAEYYLQVREANPNATITFTGHELKGPGSKYFPAPPHQPQ